MTDRELMKMALEALTSHRIMANERNNILKALRERLSQPEPEPVGKVRYFKDGWIDWNVSYLEPDTMLYTLPPNIEAAVKAEREECAKVCDAEATVEGIAQKCAEAIRKRNGYTAPPKKKWVGLTLEEVNQCYEETVDEFQFAQIIEAKLKEKNT